MKAVCWHGPLDVRVERVPDPRILNPRDAVVRVTATAIDTVIGLTSGTESSSSGPVESGPG